MGFTNYRDRPVGQTHFLDMSVLHLKSHIFWHSDLYTHSSDECRF